jgi:hypothetical protein
MQKLTCLYNADGEVVGYFSDYGVAMAARQEWNAHYDQRVPRGQSKLSLGLICRSTEVTIAPLELENVEPGDGDRIDFVYEVGGEFARGIAAKRVEGAMGDWLREGATSVEVQRFLVNKYRRPSMSAKDSDLGGPVDVVGVLYVLRIKAPK